MFTFIKVNNLVTKVYSNQPIKLLETLTYFFSSCYEDIKVFCQFFEAIAFDFIYKSYWLLKITFQNKQKMLVTKYTWQDVYVFLC